MRILMTSIVDLLNSQHNRLYQFIRYLSREHQIILITVNDWWKGSQGDLDSYVKDFSDVLDRIEYYRLTERRISPVLQEAFARAKLKEILKSKFDVHLDYNTIVSGYHASKHVRTVYDLADDLGAMIAMSPQVPRVLKPFGHGLGRMLLQRNIKAACKVTVATELMTRLVDIPARKLTLIPNGVDTSLFREEKNAKEALNIEGPLLGYVGALREWVNLEPVFEAMSMLNDDVRLLVVGKEGRFEEIARQAYEHGVGKRVIFAGMVPYAKVPLYISAMDVCLIPFGENRVAQNSLPLKLFEYMACEKPVISSELQGVRLSVGDRVLYARDSAQYCNTIRVLLDDGQLRRNLGREGRQFVQSGYEWETIAQKMENVLLETASS